MQRPTGDRADVDIGSDSGSQFVYVGMGPPMVLGAPEYGNDEFLNPFNESGILDGTLPDVAV